MVNNRVFIICLAEDAGQRISMYLMYVERYCRAKKQAVEVLQGGVGWILTPPSVRLYLTPEKHIVLFGVCRELLCV